jgi:CSLREA domain-containing protein
MIVASAQAATRTVTKIADTSDGVCNADCSLREAIDAAANGDRVVFSSLFNTPQIITLSNLFPHWGGLTISKHLTITGPGSDLLTISSDGGSGWLISGNTVNLSGVTITGADETGIDNLGDLTIDGCVVTGNNESGIKHNLGTLTISNSTITENTGDLGGGIESEDDLVITGSTISNNTANDTGSGGGGIYSLSYLTMINSTVSGNAKLGGNGNGGGVYHNGTTTITNSTITNNSAAGANSASGVLKEFFSGAITVGGTIIAANVNNSVKPDVVETSFGFSSDGYNLIGNVGAATGFNLLGDQTGTAVARLDPLLDPLDDYGGMTDTHRLQANSPAIDKGYSFGLTEDQRDFGRPFDKASYPNATGGDGSDIGAYELRFSIVIFGGVFTYAGIPIRNARLVLTSGGRARRAVRTDRFGMFHFKNVPTNRTYQVNVTHRHYNCAPQTVTVQEENIAGLNFTCIPDAVP